MKKCLDTYALIEISNGNPKFMHLLEEDIVIPSLTLAEFYGVIYRTFNIETAKHWLRRLQVVCKEIPFSIILEAVVYKEDFKKQNLSFFDCAGYLYALRSNMIFVTGDKEFKHKDNIEFIRK